MAANLIFFLILLVASGATCYLAAMLRTSGLRDPRMRGFDYLCIVVSFWMILTAAHAIALPEHYFAFYKLKSVFFNIMPYLSFWFLLNFIESKAANSRPLHCFLVAMPVIALLMLFTNPLHKLYLLSYSDRPIAGPAFLVHLSMSICCLAIIYAMLFRYIIKNFQKHPVLIILGIGSIIPIVLYVAYLFVPSVKYDFTPIGYFFTIITFAYASHASRLRKTKPGMFGNALAKIAKSKEVSEGTIEDVARLISREACLALDTYKIGIWRFNNEARILECIVVFNSATGEYSIPEPLGSDFTTKYKSFIETERSVVINSASAPSYITKILAEYDPNICSFIEAPFRIGGKLIGVVCAEQNYCKAFPKKREWSLEEQSFVSSLADLMAVAIANNERQNLEKQTILDMLPVGIMIASKQNGALLYCNKRVIDIYGGTSFEKDAAGRSIFDFAPEFQPDGRKSMDVIAEALAKKSGVFEAVNLKLTGETFWTRATYCTINYNGYLAALNAIEDMTAEKERLQMLETIAQKEKEANQLKSRFLATMSHEIRTPMNAIIGMTELALSETKPNARKEHILTVKQAATNLLSIINDILDFSKIEAGRTEISNDKYSVASLLNDIVSIIRIRMIDSGVRFVVNVDSNIPSTLFGDETKIRQSVLNILNNAAKYTKQGFIMLSVYAQFKPLVESEELRVESDANLTAKEQTYNSQFSILNSQLENEVNLIFEVTDSGIGIKPEDINNLFSDFVRLDIEYNVEGMGLGLAITKGFVEAMGGNINAQSEYGKGSTFTIALPQKYSSPKALAKIELQEKKSVLIYERRDIYAQSLAFTVKNLGMDSVIVSSGEDLFNKMESHKFEYLFISLALFKKNEDTITKFGQNAKTVILAAFGEVIPEKHLNVLVMPAYCVQIANIINGAYDNLPYATGDEFMARFSAPNARVLIVDDINTNLKVAQGLLTPYGMKIDLCNSGQAAIEAVQSKHYDLVFMDHKMPGMDGIEATLRIREFNKDIPIVALTANALPEMRKLFIENGFNDFLSKPIDTAGLNAILWKWIPATPL